MAENVQECGICKEVLRASANPKLLACHHSFCLSCLEDYIKITRPGARISCPKCRTYTTLPKEGLKKLQTNFYIVETPKDDSSCDACGHNNLNSRCVDCQQNFCDRCASTHIKMASSRQHQLQEISHKPNEDEIVKTKAQHFCKLHPDEEIKMFCKKCSDVLCIICKLTAHDGHTSTDISTEATERRKTITSLIESSEEKVKSTLKNTTTTDKETQNNHSNLEKRLLALETEKNEMMRRIKKHFDDRKATIKSKLDAYQAKTRKAVSTGKTAYESFNRIIESSKKSLEEQSDLEIIMKFNKFSKEVNKIQDVRCEVTADGSILHLLEEYQKCLQMFKETQAKIPLAGTILKQRFD